MVSAGLTPVAAFICGLAGVRVSTIALSLVIRKMQIINASKTAGAIFLEVLTGMSLEKMAQAYLSHSDLGNTEYLG